MTATLKLVTDADRTPKSPRVGDLHAPLAGVQPGRRSASALQRHPVAGSLPYVRAWHGDQFRRGALVTVRGERGWITAAAGGFVYVRLDDGGRAVVRPAEITFPH